MRERRLAIVLVIPATVYLLSFTVYPLLYAISTSTKSLNLALPWKTQMIGLRNYIEAIKDTYLHESIKVSALYVAGAVALEFVIGMGIALLLKRPLKGMSFFRVALLVPMIVPPVVVGLTWRLMYHPELGLINTFLAKIGLSTPAWLSEPSTALFSVMLVDVWEWTPFIFMVLLAGLTGLPKEVFEAAKIDGASSWQIFVRVTLPLLEPLILIVLIFRTLDVIKTFDTIFILTGGGPGLSTEVLSLYIYRIGFRFFRMGYASTLSLLLLVISIIIINILIKTMKTEER